MTPRELITTALRRLHVIGAGEEATEQEYIDCLESLRGMYRSWITQGVCGRLVDVVVYDEHIAVPGTHIKRMGQFARAIRIPAITSYDNRVVANRGYELTPIASLSPQDQSPQTDHGARYEVIPPYDLAPIIISDETSSESTYLLYDGQEKNWYDISDISLDSHVPFASRDRDGFIACLQYLIAEEFAKVPSPVALQMRQAYMNNLTYKPASMQRTVPGTFL